MAEAEASATVVVTETGDVNGEEAGAGEAAAAGPAADIKPGTADLPMVSAEVPTSAAQYLLTVFAVLLGVLPIAYYFSMG